MAYCKYKKANCINDKSDWPKVKGKGHFRIRFRLRNAHPHSRWHNFETNQQDAYTFEELADLVAEMASWANSGWSTIAGLTIDYVEHDNEVIDYKEDWHDKFNTDVALGRCLPNGMPTSRLPEGVWTGGTYMREV